MGVSFVDEALTDINHLVLVWFGTYCIGFISFL